MSIGTKVLTGDPISVSQAQALISRLLKSNAEEVLAEVDRSGLRGRGGAGFPLAKN